MLLGGRAYGGGASRLADFAQIWQAADKIVYSATLQAPDSARTHVERDFDPDQIRKLKEAADRDLTVGDAHLAAHAIAAGLVDEYQLFAVPAIVGGGTRACRTWSTWTWHWRKSAGSATAPSISVTARRRNARASVSGS